MNGSNQHELLLSDDEHKQLLSSISGGLYTAGPCLRCLASKPHNPSVNQQKKLGGSPPLMVVIRRHKEWCCNGVNEDTTEMGGDREEEGEMP